jgi:hypothetical protein
MRTDSMYTLSDNLVTALKIVYTKDLCKDVAVTTGWNMVSVPVAATNMTTAALFPTATSPIFLYNNGYSSVTTAENSKGYWARFDQAQVLQMCGTAVGTIQVPVVAGWNMIGGYDKDVTVTAITTTPAGIMTSNFFGFQWLVGYSNPTTLQVGKGYWIRVSQAGTINLNPVLAKNQPSGFDNTIKSDWVKLTVKDNTGNQSILYFTKDKEIGAGYDLPPVPPAGTFDVRFAGDRNLANISTPQDIAIQSAQTALTFKAEGGDLQISDKVGGKLLNLTLHNGKEVTANLGSINMISVKSAEIPTEFALSQNHPNPFNPTTTIRYSLPSNTLVSLKVFDVLGNQVAVLVNELQEAGVYNYQFSIDQYHLSSGVYLYQLKAGNFESIKKMVVLK